MKKLFLSFAILGLALLTSCDGGKEAVKATEAEDVTTTSEGAVVYDVDTLTSTTSWKGFKIIESDNSESGHYGFVKLKSGSVSLNNGVLESGNFIANQSTFESQDLNEDAEMKAKLEAHLKSADFLDVEKYPTSSFEITGVKALTEGDYNTEISGNLNFRDVPKNISFKANVTVDGDKVSIQSEEFKINRQDFGVTFKGGAGSVIKDNVILKVDINATKK